jgi:hypothetical protein
MRLPVQGDYIQMKGDVMDISIEGFVPDPQDDNAGYIYIYICIVECRASSTSDSAYFYGKSAHTDGDRYDGGRVWNSPPSTVSITETEPGMLRT